MNGAEKDLMQIDSRNHFMKIDNFYETTFLKISLKPDGELKRMLEKILNRPAKEDEKWKFSFICRIGADFIDELKLSAMIMAECNGQTDIHISDIVPKGSDYKIRFIKRYRIIQTIIQSKLYRARIQESHL